MSDWSEITTIFLIVYIATTSGIVIATLNNFGIKGSYESNVIRDIVTTIFLSVLVAASATYLLVEVL